MALTKAAWISVDVAPPLNIDYVCGEARDLKRFSRPMLVFDEDDGEIHVAGYDGKEPSWAEWSTGCLLSGVTHWMELPEPPSKGLQPFKPSDGYYVLLQFL